jgi:hypothetical protein
MKRRNPVWIGLATAMALVTVTQVRADEAADTKARATAGSPTQTIRFHDLRMALMTVNMAGDDGIDHYHPGHSLIFDSTGHVVAMQPGEYVPEYLAPQLIHGVISVPRRP